jgi:hypothetical protein
VTEAIGPAEVTEVDELEEEVACCRLDERLDADDAQDERGGPLAGGIVLAQGEHGGARHQPVADAGQAAESVGRRLARHERGREEARAGRGRHERDAVSRPAIGEPDEE